MPMEPDNTIKKLNEKTESKPGLNKWLQDKSIKNKFSEFYLLSPEISEDVNPRISDDRQLIVERIYEQGQWHYLTHEYKYGEDAVYTYNAGGTNEEEKNELSKIFSENEYKDPSLKLPDKIAERTGLSSQRPTILKKMDKLIEEYNVDPMRHRDKLDGIIRTAADAISDSLNNMIFGRVHKDRRNDLFQLIDQAMERQHILGINSISTEKLDGDALAAVRKLSLSPEKKRELEDMLRLSHIMTKLEPLPSNFKLINNQLKKILKTIPDSCSDKQAIIEFAKKLPGQPIVAKQEPAPVQVGKPKADKKDKQDVGFTIHR